MTGRESFRRPGGDVLEGASAADEQCEPAFAQAAQDHGLASECHRSRKRPVLSGGRLTAPRSPLPVLLWVSPSPAPLLADVRELVAVRLPQDAESPGLVVELISS
jgi:hypothetical protein